MSFPSEIETYPLEDLLNLLDVYLVRNHNGEEFVRTERDNRTRILQFISDWLKPAADIRRNNNPIQAIRDNVGFTSESAQGEDIATQIFGNELEVSSAIVEDFADYPMRNAFGYDPWTLLQGYASTGDKDQYIRRFTNVDPKKFLNNTEKIFYLTRGYGRPNHQISLKDMELRSLYNNAEPTALLTLMDIFAICPTKQNPQTVRENLSNINLIAIDSFHRNAVVRVTECLRGNRICNEQGCDPIKTRCFENFLNSIGMIPMYQYDPETNAFESNLSQLRLYDPVIPDRKWNYEEIADQPDPLIAGILKTLPDMELLAITVPLGLKYADTVNTETLGNRLRSKLLREAIHFLTFKQHLISPLDDGYEIIYGRLADRNPQRVNSNEFVQSIVQSGILVDNYGNVISPDTAKLINNIFNNTELQDVIDKSSDRLMDNGRLIESMTPDQRENLRINFEKLYESDVSIDLEKLQEVLSTAPPEASKLILWKSQNSWIPLTIYFDEYFESWQPKFMEIIPDTLKYYQQIL